MRVTCHRHPNGQNKNITSSKQLDEQQQQDVQISKHDLNLPIALGY
ncbi:hypothetical protein AWV72_00356 [Lactiplantibacillus plantarum]|nr:hypothetical protein AWV72_00356 [Lactiplantibacillus plantarum]